MKNNMLRCSVVFFLVLGVLVPSSMVQALETNRATVVTVSEMCGGCVTKITKHFGEVKEISELKCDVPTKSVNFVPKKGIELSPLKIWEEMEKIGKAPTKLVGPSGTFTSKPKK